MKVKLVHHILDGYCVTCGDTREWLADRPQTNDVVDLVEDSLVWWDIRQVVDGKVETIDQTFAPSQREAAAYVKSHPERFGAGATVRLDLDQLSIASTEAGAQ